MEFMKLTKELYLEILNIMATYGTAPMVGCSELAVGYENILDKLKNKYFIQAFGRGASAEKFVVGPFGSGKTHFLRWLMEIAQDCNCATAEVSLNRNIDFTDNAIVYGEVVHEIKVPLSEDKGIRNLLYSFMENVKNMVPDINLKETILKDWISGIDKTNIQFSSYSKIIKKALNAMLDDNEETVDMCCRWLEGDFNNKKLAESLNVSVIDKKSNNLYFSKALLSLFQLIKHAGFNGTVVCFDEAEQGFNVDRKKMTKILSMLQSDINRISDLKDGSVLIVYAFTPDIYEKMMNYPALQQRISNPPGRDFASGNVLAPVIKLDELGDGSSLKELVRIGEKLVNIFYDFFASEITSDKEELIERVNKIANDIYGLEITSSNKRDMTKATCTMLLEELGIAEKEASVAEDFSEFEENEV